MNINNRIATLDVIFQELKDSHPQPIYISKRKYKLSDEDLYHIEAMLSETGLVEVISKPYSVDMFTLNSCGLNELKKYKNYSDLLSRRAELSPNTQQIAPYKIKIQNFGSSMVSNIVKIIIGLLIGYLLFRLGWN